MSRKSTVDEIRARFDADVERFANLETGHAATVDALLGLELVCEAAAVSTPRATHLLDIGCGAGNYSLKLLASMPHLHVTLIDLSQPMLDRARQRLLDAGCEEVSMIRGDVRDLDLGSHRFDIVLAASVLHHLREDAQWQSVFKKLYQAIRPGGGVWIFDLIDSSMPAIAKVMKDRYGRYLEQLKDTAYRDLVFDYIDKEDTPRPLTYQLDLLRAVGFDATEVLHKHSCFAAFGATKSKTT